MNTNLMQEIMRAAAMVNAMETETEAAVKELEASVAKSRKEKELHIVEFLMAMQKALVDAKYPKNRMLNILLPWDTKEGLYRWPVALCLASLEFFETVAGDFYPIAFGRYYSGSKNVSHTVVVCKMARYLSKRHDACAEDIYQKVVDGWNEKIEAMIETKVAEAVKETLTDRMNTMKNRLAKATTDHKKYTEVA